MNKQAINDFYQVAELSFARFLLNADKDTLMVSYYESTEITLEKAEAVIDLVYPYAKAGAIYGITDLTANYLSISEEARKYFQSNKANDLNLAHAVVLESLATRILVNFFQNINKPTMPLKIFNNFDSAINWLNAMKA